MIYFITLFRYFINLFYSFHCLSFPFPKRCRLEKGHIVPVLCSHSLKKKEKLYESYDVIPMSHHPSKYKHHMYYSDHKVSRSKNNTSDENPSWHLAGSDNTYHLNHYNFS